MPRTGWGFLGLLASLAAIVAIAWLLFSLLGGERFKPGADFQPLAEFKVIDTSVDDSCTTLGDYCVRVGCVVTNTGLAGGTASVTMTLTRSGGAPVVHAERVDVPRKERRVVIHDFREAGMFDSRVRGRCDVH